ncbi:MAG: amidohydrolase [Sphingomonas sp.]|nr:MAG: amidohydrolase [Sphingomonas sp.]
MTLQQAPLAAQETARAANGFDGLAAGPYRRLVILNAMVIPGHGGPAAGPFDIVIEGNRITSMTPFDPVTVGRRGATVRPTGDRVIDASGKYVMPGMIDLHMHIRGDPLPLAYNYYLKLAHGVTTQVPAPDRGLANAMAEAGRSARNEILAPRMYPIWSWDKLEGYTREQLEDPKQAARIAKEIVAKGAHVISVGNLGWNAELFGAVCKAVTEAGGITTVPLPPSTMPVVNALKAAKLGVTMIEHHYGYAESALDRTVQDFPRDYNYDDESDRFRHAGVVWTEANREPARTRLLGDVAKELAESGVTMLPTRVVYEANRDILRAQGLPWHGKYTHKILWDLFLPNPSLHGGYFWDWTSDDQAAWTDAYRLWGDLIYAFNKEGGRVAYGTDDSYIWATPGFSNIRELELSRESGLHNYEVLKAATHNSALTLRQPKLGLVRPGYLADLLIVDGNPAYNLQFMYSFGALTLDGQGEMIRTKGILHTIKDGIVIENARLMDEVAKMVAESRRNSAPDAVTAPFLP